jgi:hypothetical protein
MAKQVIGCDARIQLLKKVHTHSILLTKVGQHHIGQKRKQPVVDAATVSLGSRLSIMENFWVLPSDIE